MHNFKTNLYWFARYWDSNINKLLEPQALKEW